MGMKVAIIGLWAETHDLAPWDDPSWQKWCVAWDVDAVAADRAFEMHDNRVLRACCADGFDQYVERLSLLPALYVQEPVEGLGTVYPLDEVAKTTGAYWASSVGYMLALAIHEGADEIGLWGVSMEAGEEYGYQRPNVEYLIGLARGKGITVHIPEQSSLCKFGGQFGHVDRYGWSG